MAGYVGPGHWSRQLLDNMSPVGSSSGINRERSGPRPGGYAKDKSSNSQPGFPRDVHRFRRCDDIVSENKTVPRDDGPTSYRNQLKINLPRPTPPGRTTPSRIQRLSSSVGPVGPKQSFKPNAIVDAHCQPINTRSPSNHQVVSLAEEAIHHETRARAKSACAGAYFIDDVTRTSSWVSYRLPTPKQQHVQRHVQRSATAKQGMSESLRGKEPSVRPTHTIRTNRNYQKMQLCLSLNDSRCSCRPKTTSYLNDSARSMSPSRREDERGQVAAPATAARHRQTKATPGDLKTARSAIPHSSETVKSNNKLHTKPPQRAKSASMTSAKDRTTKLTISGLPLRGHKRNKQEENDAELWDKDKRILKWLSECNTSISEGPEPINIVCY